MRYRSDEYYDVSSRRSKSQVGGIVFNNFVHDIDLLHYFLAPTIRVHAEKSITRRKHDGQEAGDQAEEGVALTLKFASGVVGTFLMSETAASPHNFGAANGDDPGLPQTWFDEKAKQEVDVYRFFGTEVMLSVPDMTLWSLGNQKKSWKSVLEEKLLAENDGSWPFERRLDHFARVVRREEEPNCTGKDGLLAVMVCDAVRRALERESGRVDIPLLP
jgi:predicted dehydrogenase